MNALKVAARALLIISIGSTAGFASDPAAVMTSFTVLVGHPSGEPAASGGVLLVPGTVIPLEGASAGGATEGREAAVQRFVALTRAVDKLWSTFRLDPARRIQRGSYLLTRVGESVHLPELEEADVVMSATLMGFNDTVATYHVVFRQGEASLADSTVGISRGGRAVVGGMDGEAAPYLFVIVEPDPPGSASAGSVRFTEESGISEPVAVERVNPRYPEQARRDKIMGTVVLDLVIGKDGRVLDIHTLESAHPLLEGAAIEAVKQWRFEPAHRADGTEVQVLYVMTIKFNLQ